MRVATPCSFPCNPSRDGGPRGGPPRRMYQSTETRPSGIAEALMNTVRIGTGGTPSRTEVKDDQLRAGQSSSTPTDENPMMGN